MKNHYRSESSCLSPVLSTQYWVLSTFCVLCAAIQPTQAAAPGEPVKLTIGMAQLGLEPTLDASRDKIVRFIREAKDRGCRVVVFPETALYWPPSTPIAEIDAAAELLRQTVDANDVYALIGGVYKRNETEKPFERLLVIDQEGRVVQSYNKMWDDVRFPTCPGIFEIDGVPCVAAICADRWIRGVEDLPAVAGAKILF